MKIVLKLDTREEIDLMNPPRVNSERDVTLTQDRERDDFKRTVEDITVVASDMDDVLGKIFKSYPITSRWGVVVTDNGRQTFSGRIERPISSDPKSEWLTIQAFSKNKDFWDRAKATRIRSISPSLVKASPDAWFIQNYATLLNVLMWNLDAWKEEDMFTGYAISTLYTSRPIRWRNSVQDRNIGNEGRYEDLDPRTTIFDLLTAMTVYYNAEIFIDPETNLLTMLRRNDIQNDTAYDLDDLILDDEEIKVDDADGRKYDYIKIAFGLPIPPPIEAVGTYNPEAIDYDKVVYTLRTIVGDIETEKCDVFIPEMYFTNTGSGSTAHYRAFRIPAAPSGFVHGSLYVQIPGTQVFRKAIDLATEDLAEYPGNFIASGGTIEVRSTPTFFRVTLNVPSGITLMENGAAGDLYLSKDETTGSWETIYSRTEDVDLIQGKILDTTPQLTFIDRVTGAPIAPNFFSAWSFFGREINLNTFAAQWEEMFLTKTKVFCSIRDTAYRLGDSFVTSRHPKIPGGKYVLKKASGELMRERTRIELIKK